MPLWLELSLAVLGTTLVLGAATVLRRALDVRASDSTFAAPIIPPQHRGHTWRWLLIDLWSYAIAAPFVVTAIILIAGLAIRVEEASLLRIAFVFTVSTMTGMLFYSGARLTKLASRLATMEEWLEGSGIQQGQTRLSETDYRRIVGAAVASWNDFDLVCVTGYATIGKKESVLADLVAAPRGRIRVLLMDPYCDAFEARAERLGLAADEYRLASRATISILERLQRQGYDVTYKFFRTTPVWRMYLGPAAALFQAASAPSRFEAPLYGVRRTEQAVSLYDALRVYFDDRWRGLPAPSPKTQRMVEQIRGELEEKSGLFTLQLQEEASLNGLDQPLVLPARPRRKATSSQP